MKKYIFAVVLLALCGGLFAQDRAPTEMPKTYIKRKQWQNVRDFGAVGDDSTLNDTAFSAAITAAGDKGIVFVPSGTFLLSDTLVLGDSITLCGVGVASVIKADSGHNENIITITNKTGTVIRDLMIDGNNANNDSVRSAIIFVGCTDFMVSNVKIVNMYGQSIGVGGEGNPSSDGVIEHCKISGGSSNHIDVNSSQNVRILNNTITGAMAGEEGIFLGHGLTEDHLVMGNRVDSANFGVSLGNNMFVSDTSSLRRIRIIGNSFVSNQHSGIALWGASHCIIANNECVGNNTGGPGGSGIYLADGFPTDTSAPYDDTVGSTHNVIIGNRCYDTANAQMYGLQSIGKSDSNYVSGNDFAGNNSGTYSLVGDNIFASYADTAGMVYGHLWVSPTWAPEIQTYIPGQNAPLIVKADSVQFAFVEQNGQFYLWIGDSAFSTGIPFQIGGPDGDNLPAIELRADTTYIDGNAVIDSFLVVGAYKFPMVDGTGDQVLTTNGSGVLAWNTQVGAGGGESNTIQDTGVYNDTEGFGLSGGKAGVDLHVKGLIEGSNITITASGDSGLAIAASGGAGTLEDVFNYMHPDIFDTTGFNDSIGVKANGITDGMVTDALTVTGYMQDEDINTFAELQSWVSGKTLLNEEDAATIDVGWTFAGLLAADSINTAHLVAGNVYLGNDSLIGIDVLVSDTVVVDGDVIKDFTGTNLSVTAGVLNASAGGLSYWTESDDNDTSVFTATGPNTTVGLNDDLTMQANNIIGVGSIRSNSYTAKSSPGHVYLGNSNDSVYFVGFGYTVLGQNTDPYRVASWARADTAAHDTAEVVRAEIKDTGDVYYQPLEATLTDIADGTIEENLVNTTNPWADNEIATSGNWNTAYDSSQEGYLNPDDPNVDTAAWNAASGGVWVASNDTMFLVDADDDTLAAFWDDDAGNVWWQVATEDQTLRILLDTIGIGGDVISEFARYGLVVTSNGLEVDTANAVADAETKPVTGNAVFDFCETTKNYLLSSELYPWTDSTGFLVGWGGVAKSVVNDTNYFRFEGGAEFDTTGGSVSLAANAIDTSKMAHAPLGKLIRDTIAPLYPDTAETVDTIQGVLTEGGYLTNSKFSDSSITLLNATAWRLFYSNATTTAIQELILGGNGTYLKSNGASSAPTWATPAGSGLWATVGNADTATLVGVSDTLMTIADTGTSTSIETQNAAGFMFLDPIWVDNLTVGTGITVPDNSISPAELDEGASYIWAADHVWSGGDGIFQVALIVDDEIGDSPSLIIRDGDDKFLTFRKYDAGFGMISNNEADIRFYFSNDLDDYIYLDTSAANVPMISTGGDCDLVLNASSGEISFGDENLTTTGNITSPLVIGGTATTSDLSLKTTSGVGATGADMHFLVGDNGATEAITILNNGNVGIGKTSPDEILYLFGNNATLKLEDDSENKATINVGNSQLCIAIDPDDLVISSDICFDIDGDEVARLHQNTNFGIGTGTATPPERISVVGNIATGDTTTGDVDVFHYFSTDGSWITEYLKWDDGLGRFEFSDDLDVTGNLTVSGTVDTVDVGALAAKVHNEDLRHFVFAFSNPNAVYDTDSLLCIKPVTEKAITITRIDVTCDADPATEPAMKLNHTDNFISRTSPTDIDVITTTNGVTTITSGFDDATIPATRCIYFAFTADPEAAIKSITVDITYTVD